MMKRISFMVLALLALVIPAGAQNAPSVSVSDQVSLDGSVWITSAVSDGPGFVVIHIDNGQGAPGPVIGNAPLYPGQNFNIRVWIDAAQATPTLFAMLHADTGEVGVYEFGTVEGADGPVRVNNQVLTFPINVAPGITYEGALEGSTLTVASALMDGPGWLAIHANNNDAPGPVIGTAPLRSGVNGPITVTVDPAAAGDLVFPMLHFDTNEAGVYEFGSVEGADGPVFVGGNVVVGPLALGAAAGGCTVTGANVNLRTGPGTNFGVAGTLSATANAVGQATGADGFVWFNLDSGNWVRSDVVTAEGDCASLPAAAVPEAPAAPAQPPAPAATEEASA